MAKDLSYTICTQCYRGNMQLVGERQGGFSGGKAALGAILVGPIGLAAGALGKKKRTYRCTQCGFTIEV